MNRGEVPSHRNNIRVIIRRLSGELIRLKGSIATCGHDNNRISNGRFSRRTLGRFYKVGVGAIGAPRDGTLGTFICDFFTAIGTLFKECSIVRCRTRNPTTVYFVPGLFGVHAIIAVRKLS